MSGDFMIMALGVGDNVFIIFFFANLRFFFMVLLCFPFPRFVEGGVVCEVFAFFLSRVCSCMLGIGVFFFLVFLIVFSFWSDLVGKRVAGIISSLVSSGCYVFPFFPPFFFETCFLRFVTGCFCRFPGKQQPHEWQSGNTNGR
ncbi:hypothetical protein EX30DRAFT_68005 [Ascodesmis nigricans]|uniref:Transmembrane protein n=1 Tax=Ascodesmis nigricans TaxID=341454 RepID=A0A4V3SIG5_9PEZI|nr:hypothetical protein EX30DRAFT_68005 [Ascodesmis nigricans]